MIAISQVAPLPRRRISTVRSWWTRRGPSTPPPTRPLWNNAATTTRSVPAAPGSRRVAPTSTRTTPSPTQPTLPTCTSRSGCGNGTSGPSHTAPRSPKRSCAATPMVCGVSCSTLCSRSTWAGPAPRRSTRRWPPSSASSTGVLPQRSVPPPIRPWRERSQRRRRRARCPPVPERRHRSEHRYGTPDLDHRAGRDRGRRNPLFKPFADPAVPPARQPAQGRSVRNHRRTRVDAYHPGPGCLRRYGPLCHVRRPWPHRCAVGIAAAARRTPRI